jgi:hypothetical protein
LECGFRIEEKVSQDDFGLSKRKKSKQVKREKGGRRQEKEGKEGNRFWILDWGASHCGFWNADFGLKKVSQELEEIRLKVKRVGGESVIKNCILNQVPSIPFCSTNGNILPLIYPPFLGCF